MKCSVPLRRLVVCVCLASSLPFCGQARDGIVEGAQRLDLLPHLYYRDDVHEVSQDATPSFEDCGAAPWVRLIDAGDRIRRTRAPELFHLCFRPEELPVTSRQASLFAGRLWARFTVYADDVRLYAARPPVESLHFTWHLVSVPADARVIGLDVRHRSDQLFQIRDFAYGDETAHVLYLIRSQLDLVSFGIMFVLIGLFVGVLTVVGRGERRAVVAFDALSISVGVYTIALSDVSRLIVDAPAFWTCLLFLALFAIPVALGIFTASVLEERRRPLVRILWKIHLAHALAFVALFVTTGLQHQFWIVLTVFVMYLISLTIYLVRSAKQAVQGSSRSRIYFAGFLVFTIFTAYDIFGGYLAVLPWQRYTFHWGMLVFIFALGYILERRFHVARRGIAEHARELERMNAAYARFVPREFLRYMGKESIVDVELGDTVEMELTLMVTDIHSFTSLSERMTPEENFDFVNSYFRKLAPIIREHHGFVAKYMGDGIMAAFPGAAESALEAAIEIQSVLAEYNKSRRAQGRDPVQTGVSIHSGVVRLGTVGEEERMQGDVMADAANTAARLEGLTKYYGARVVFSGQTLFALEDPTRYHFRILDTVIVKGKQEPVSVIELFADPEEENAKRKLETRENFEKGFHHYHGGEFREACESFRAVLRHNPDDLAAQQYLKRAEYFAEHGTPPDWQSIQMFEHK